MITKAAGAGDVSPLPTVTVVGEAIVRTDPDEALLWLTLSALEAEPGTALADVAARSDSLLALLAELGINGKDRSTSGIRVQEEFDHTKGGRRSIGHRASAVTEIRLIDPALIGELLSRATQDLAAQVSGPQWQIAPDNPARLEAARQAAADGRRKAQAYAEGAGARLGRLMKLSEPEGPGWPVRVAARMKQPSMGEPMPVEAGEHDVRALIRVTFALAVDDPAAEPELGQVAS